jgi:hypothetical protein
MLETTWRFINAGLIVVIAVIILSLCFPMLALVDGKCKDWMERFKVELLIIHFGGKWIKYKILPGSDGSGQLNPVTENLKALPFFISLHELLPVVIKKPVFMPVSLHFRSLTFI